MQLHLFGATTSTGEAFRRLAAATPIGSLHVYSRRPVVLAAVVPDRAVWGEAVPDSVLQAPEGPTAGVHAADFSQPASFHPAGEPGDPGLWISFAPIWLLAPFLQQLALEDPGRLSGLRGLIACSSSSALTKRFAANRFDRDLAARLIAAEQQLLHACHRLQVPCRILRPALIYGQVGPYRDRNLSRLLELMRRFPLLPLPAHSGLRQPIHARQLATVALKLCRQLIAAGFDPNQPELIDIGGDQSLSYRAMLQALQQAQPPADPARRCRLLALPDRLFLLLASPLLLRSPRSFEAVQRIAADLAGFTPSHQLLEQPPTPFPLLPLA